MSQPIIFISHFHVREGRIDGLRRLTAEVTQTIEAEKPHTLAYLSFIDAVAKKLAFVHAFADAESMDLHFEGAEGRSRAAYEFLEPDGWEIYGTPSQAALGMMRQAAESPGVELRLQPELLEGFIRLAPSR